MQRSVAAVTAVLKRRISLLLVVLPASYWICLIPVRDIPMPLVTSGVEHGNLRELALARMKDLGTEVNDALLPYVNTYLSVAHFGPFDLSVLL